MAYAAPTLASTGSTATAGTPMTVIATLTSTGDVAVTVTGLTCVETTGSFPCAIGDPVFFPLLGSREKANTGEGATNVALIPVVFHKAGSAKIRVFMEGTRDDSGVRFSAVASDLTVTVS